MRFLRDRKISSPFCRVQPNKRLKLPGPAFRGGVRLCASELVPQGGTLALVDARPAA